MLDLIAIAQSAPGPIAVNGAIVAGYKLAGIPGVLVCIIATVLPPFPTDFCCFCLLYYFSEQSCWIRLLLERMQSGVAAVIASVVLRHGSRIGSK